jgi:TPR repeat protein
VKARCLPLLLAAAMALPATGLANGELERAIQAYERSHYAESVRLLRPAAEGGNLRAQEMLGFMHLYGSALYGAEVPRDPDQARYWLQRAAAAGSSVATRGLQWIKAQTARADATLGTRSRSE